MKWGYLMLLLALLVTFLSVSSLLVKAGYLTATSEPGPEGTTFTIFWRQGFGSGMVYFFNGADYGTRTLNLGPNSCNLAGTVGNSRAIHVSVNADASGPYTPDAVVRCDICGCEDVPNTNFRCRTASGALQYSCEECDACISNPCPSGQTCTHVTCTERTCSGCDSVVCESQTTSWSSWSSCDAPIAMCGTTSGQERRTRTVYSCSSSGNCVGNLETQYQACTRSNGGCTGRWDCTGSCASYVSGTCTGYSCGYSCSGGTCVQSCSTSMMVCEIG